MSIGTRIKAALTARNMTQTKLAEITGFTDVYISNIVTGMKGKNLNIGTLSIFANALNVPMAYLLEETDVMDHNETFVLQKPTTNKTFGQLLKDILKARGLNTSTLAKLDIGVKAIQIGHYTRDSRLPHVTVLQRMAEVLNVPVGYFFGEVPLETVLKQDQDSSKSPLIAKLMGIIRDLDMDGIDEVIRQAEKEKSLQDYKKITPPSKKSS